MDETDRIAAAAAEAAAQVFASAVARSMDELEKRIVDVTGIDGDDDDGLIVGRVTFGPEVERARKGIMPGPNGEGCVRTSRGPLNRPDPDPSYEVLEELMDIDAINDHLKGGDGHVSTPPPPEGIPAPKTTTQETLGDGADGGGKRMNAGKLRIELIPPEWFVALADVMTQGSKKYAPRNWEQGMKWSTMIGSMKRHVAKFEAGERYDGDGFDLEKGTTGCHHLAMIAWNALALMTYDLLKKGTNDLPDNDGLTLLKRVNAATSDKGNNIHDE